jgi:hypothetical protein
MSQSASSGRFLTRAMGKAEAGWLSRPTGRLVVLLLGMIILTAPVWLLSDLLRGFTLLPTDFIYIQESRDIAALRRYLMAPLNMHVVPLFRLWTFTLVCLAGRLEELPRVFLTASYFSLVVTMVLAGVLVQQETGRTAVALSSMACLGISTVIMPAVTHYAAGQALWAGAGVVATLVTAKAWRAKGGNWRLGLTWLGVIASPFIWSGGLTAGPAVGAALWVDSRPQCRRAAVAMLIATSVVAAAIVWLSRDYIHQTSIVWERHIELWPRPVQAVLHTCQAIAEALLFQNLGLDAISSPFQAVVIVGCVGGLWYASRGRFSRATPLEAAGAVVVAVSALMTYFFRGNLPFSSVRPVVWYYLMPQVGAVLLAAGWWAGIGPRAACAGGHLTWRGALAVAVLVMMLFAVQAVRAERILFEGAPPFAPSEIARFPNAELKRLRALYFKDEAADRQRRMLARLDRVEQIARRHGIGKAAIRRAFGRVLVTGLPANQQPYDAAGMLSLPDGDPNVSPMLVRSTLADYYWEELATPPPWLLISDPWPVKDGDSR